MSRLCAIAIVVCYALMGLNIAHAAKSGDSFAVWVKTPAFNKLYGKALGKSPVNHPNSWVYRDIGLAKSTSFAGENGNTWTHLITCSSKNAAQCRQNHIDVFYDEQNKELFAYVTLGNRVGWVGSMRSPTSLEQKFFAPYLTAKSIAKEAR
jgi:hypothetical protein